MRNKIQALLELNKKHSDLFASHRLERELYLANHPTTVVVFKCMDGRVHMPTVTHTPLGIMRPYRNIGGKFNLGWPLLNDSFDRTIMKAVQKGKRVLVLVTYHFSAGDPHRGCAGFHYDCEAAKKHTSNFKEQIEKVYGKNNKVVYPVLVGLETDRDALIIHGENGSLLDMSTIADSSDSNLELILRNMFLDMPERILEDFLPLLKGNIEHMAETKDKKPLDQLEHGEWILAVGKGFDWLHTPNMALIVGPYDPNIGEPIKTAASIIKANIEAGKAEKGFVILSSAVYSDAAEIARAKERSLYLGQLAKEIVEKNFPERAKDMYALSVIFDANTMKMEPIGDESIDIL